MSETIEKTLADRGSKYGAFTGHASITQRLKDAVHSAMNARPAGTFTPVHVEALDMIMHKVGRILNGDPNYADSWHDIAGYAQLAENECMVLQVAAEMDNVGLCVACGKTLIAGAIHTCVRK